MGIVELLPIKRLLLHSLSDDVLILNYDAWTFVNRFTLKFVNFDLNISTSPIISFR